MRDALEYFLPFPFDTDCGVIPPHFDRSALPPVSCLLSPRLACLPCFVFCVLCRAAYALCSLCVRFVVCHCCCYGVVLFFAIYPRELGSPRCWCVEWEPRDLDPSPACNFPHADIPALSTTTPPAICTPLPAASPLCENPPAARLPTALQNFCIDSTSITRCICVIR